MTTSTPNDDASLLLPDSMPLPDSMSLLDHDVVLAVEGVSKKFCRSLKRSLFYGLQDIGSELLSLRPQTNELRTGEFWALKDVSFQLRQGESLGLVGVNGSGKTTLLRIISGLIRPDTGTVKVRGRVAPLIALGAGFNPVLTGRENIYANMSILGLSKKEIDDRFDQVISFAAIDDAIDAPVHSYSSGMAARLGFACAIHTEPDILLIDEVLAVGDTRFRGKCFRKLNELREKGTSFILVSHNAFHILTVCPQSIYLRRGQLIGYGNSAEIIKRYEDDLFLEDLPDTSAKTSNDKSTRMEDSGLAITDVYFKDSTELVVETPISGEPVSLCINCQVQRSLDPVYFTINILGSADEGQMTLHFSSYRDGQPLSLTPGTHELQLKMPYLGLKLGIYNLNVYISEGPLHNLDSLESFRFTVQAKESMSRSQFYQPRSWHLVKNSASIEQEF